MNSIVTIDNAGGGRSLGYRERDPIVEFRLAMLTDQPTDYPNFYYGIFPCVMVGICSYDLKARSWNGPKSQMSIQTHLVNVNLTLPETIIRA